MRQHEYKNYEEYIKKQIDGHCRTAYRTKKREPVRQGDVKTIRELVPDAQTILCVGCRDASEPNTFNKLGFKARGIDLLGAKDPDALVVKGDMNKLPDRFDENSFDLCYSCHSIEHSIQPAAMLKGMLYVARIGAYIAAPLFLRPGPKDPTSLGFMDPRAKRTPDLIAEEITALVGEPVEVLGLHERKDAKAFDVSSAKNPLDVPGLTATFLVRLA